MRAGPEEREVVPEGVGLRGGSAARILAMKEDVHSMSETTKTRAKRRKIVEPVKVTDLKGKLIERYREVLLDNTEKINEALSGWDRAKDLEVGPVVRNAGERDILVAYYRTFGYTVNGAESEAGLALVFAPIQIEVKIEDLFPPVAKAERKKRGPTVRNAGPR